MFPDDDTLMPHTPSVHAKMTSHCLTPLLPHRTWLSPPRQWAGVLQLVGAIQAE